jgi:hypothetical protein
MEDPSTVEMAVLTRVIGLCVWPLDTTSNKSHQRPYKEAKHKDE